MKIKSTIAALTAISVAIAPQPAAALTVDFNPTEQQVQTFNLPFDSPIYLVPGSHQTVTFNVHNQAKEDGILAVKIPVVDKKINENDSWKDTVYVTGDFGNGEFKVPISDLNSLAETRSILAANSERPITLGFEMDNDATGGNAAVAGEQYVSLGMQLTLSQLVDPNVVPEIVEEATKNGCAKKTNNSFSAKLFGSSDDECGNGDFWPWGLLIIILPPLIIALLARLFNYDSPLMHANSSDETVAKKINAAGQKIQAQSPFHQAGQGSQTTPASPDQQVAASGQKVIRPMLAATGVSIIWPLLIGLMFVLIGTVARLRTKKAEEE